MTFKEWIEEEIRINRFAMESSTKLAMNSYGAGYDTGWVNALEAIQKMTTPEMAASNVEPENL